MARWRNHCCRGKAVSSKYDDYVPIFLPYLFGMKIAFFHAIICHPWSIWLYRIFPHYLINGTVIEQKTCSDFLYKFCLEDLSLREKFREIL